MPTKLLIATGNAGKVREIRHELEVHAPGCPWLGQLEVIGLKDLPTPPPDCVEDRPTFIGNATKRHGTTRCTRGA